MNTQEREHIGRLIERFALRAPTDDLLIFIAETGGMFEACSRLVREAASGDRAIVDWLRQQCQAARVRPAAFLAEIEDILTVIKPSQEHADLFAVLELEPGASREAIKQSYRRLCRRYHPDTGGGNRDDAAFMRITNAYHQLLHGEAQAPASTAARREGSHWRRALVPDIAEARRAQKRKNVVVVALLALVLVFVSLLAARTYNSRVMMTGLKNKSLASGPPTTTPSVPETTTTAAAPSPTRQDEQAAKTGRAAHPESMPSASITASKEAQPTPNDAPSAPPRTAAKRVPADDTTPPPSETLLIAPLASTTPLVAIASGQAASTRMVETPATDPAPPVEKPVVHLTPGKKKKVAPSTTVAAQHQTAASPVPTLAAASPAFGQSDAAAAKPTIAAAQPPPVEHAANAGCAARTDCTPPAATTAGTEAQPASTPSSAATTKKSPQPPTQPQPRERIDAFLHAYTAAYEQKNLPTFARFFAADATENGKTLNEVLSAYQNLFTTAQTLRFTVSPQKYEHHQGQLHLRGRFTSAMTFKDDVTTSGQGDITFRLTDTTPPQVQTLRYTFDQ